MSKQTKGEEQYLEILGDTVTGKQLIVSVLLSVAVSLSGYKLGQYVFPKFASENMVDSYSLLVGIVGTLLVLGVCSFLFKPKRILVEDAVSASNLAEVFQDLQLDYEEEIRLIKEDPIIQKELEELGVLKNFESKRGEQS